MGELFAWFHQLGEWATTTFQAALDANSPWVYLWAFLGGLADCLTPCSAFATPMAVSYFAVSRRQGHDARTMYKLGAVFFIALCLTYMSFGLLAAWIGKGLFQWLGQSPLPYLAIGLFLAALLIAKLITDLVAEGKLSSESWAFKAVPGFLKQTGSVLDPNAIVEDGGDGAGGGSPKVRRGTYLGAAGAGVAVATLMGPCAAPILTLMVAVVASKGDPWFGVSLLLAFAVGIGSFMLAVGFTGGAASALFKGVGPWRVWVDRSVTTMVALFAILLLWMAYDKWVEATLDDDAGMPRAHASMTSADTPELRAVRAAEHAAAAADRAIRAAEAAAHAADAAARAAATTADVLKLLLADRWRRDGSTPPPAVPVADPQAGGSGDSSDTANTDTLPWEALQALLPPPGGEGGAPSPVPPNADPREAPPTTAPGASPHVPLPGADPSEPVVYDAVGPAPGVEPLTTSAELKVGYPAPAFVYREPSGALRNSMDRRGKPLFITMWATWCVACLEEVPEIKAMRDVHGDALDILAVNAGDKRGAMLRKMASAGIDYPVIHDPDDKIYELFGLKTIPFNLLLDAQGRVLYFGGGFPKDHRTLLEGTAAPP